MGLPKEVVILIVIVGCIVATLLGYAIHSLATNNFAGINEPKEFSDEQRRYMREYRLKQLAWMARDAKEMRYNRPSDIETPLHSGVYSRPE
ncbi:uncharacterized protein BDV14DRAFT_210746 [Aspergillus stella-maris]|uniref:uncharacterized protein n=1 Tax=Aspergillus stella-maris TaxID=1810926 RepID=UPI003CCCDD0E